MATPSLLDWIMDLLRSDDAREAFHSNPQAALQSAGFSAACGEDVAEARTFVADTPGMQLVKDAFLPEDTDDAAESIRYILNNYTYYDSHDRYLVAGDKDIDDLDDLDGFDDDDDDDHHPGFGFDLDPDANDQDVDQEDNDKIQDSTVTDSNLGTQDSFNPSVADSFNPTTETGETTVDQSGSTVGDGNQAGRDLIDIGGGNVGGDSIGTGNVLVGDDAAGRDQDTVTGGLAGLDHTVETGDVHVLSDLVNTDDVARNSLNDLDLFSHVDEQNIVQDLQDVVNLLG